MFQKNQWNMRQTMMMMMMIQKVMLMMTLSNGEMKLLKNVRFTKKQTQEVVIEDTVEITHESMTDICHPTVDDWTLELDIGYQSVLFVW